MPVIFRHKSYRFFFYSNEGIPREALHVHVRKGSAVAKFWLEPVPEVADSHGWPRVDSVNFWTWQSSTRPR